MREYEKELLKQSDPYEYYLKYVLKNEKGEHENVPFICSENETHRIYDAGDYVIYENKSGHSSDYERNRLCFAARKCDADLMYTDIDHIDGNGKRHTPFFKSCFGPETFECFDYISDFFAIRKSLASVPVQDMGRIIRLPEVLFHFDAEIDATGNNQGIYEKYMQGVISPDYFGNGSILVNKVTIIIPSKDNPELLSNCLKGIKNAKDKVKFSRVETIVVDNGSSEENKEIITKLINGYTDVLYIYEPMEFNFSRMCNIGAEKASGDYLLFLNDDIEITDDEFILKLLYYAMKDEAGAVSCKLLYPGDEKRIQHAGITDLMYAGPSHKLSTFPDDKVYYFGRNTGVHNCLAVTGACLMVNKEKYFKVGGFRDKMKVGYNDVDMCISLYENGYRNIVNLDLSLIHHESVTRGHDSQNIDKLKRLSKEREMLYDAHPFLRFDGDPYYNVNLAGDFLDYRVNVIPAFENRLLISEKLSDDESKKLFGKNAKKKNNKNAFMSIDSVTREYDLNGEKECYVINGWALMNKKDNAFNEAYLCIKDDAERVSAYSVFSKLRTDIKDVFPEAVNTELSGFTVKIPVADVAELDSSMLYTAIVNKKNGRRYYAGY